MPDEAGASSALAEPVRVEEQPLGLLLHRAQSALRTEVTATALKSMGLTFREYICMRILRRSPGKSNAELARDLNVSPQATIVVVRSLQHRALLTRPRSASSGRVLPARLTSQGINILKRTESEVRATEDRILTKLTRDEQRSLRRLLNALG
jgi:DNA-binding MarR family transcriptional regulator